jgi:hypothetical protein
MNKEALADAKRATEVLKGMNGNLRGLLIQHLINLQQEHVTKLTQHTDPHQIYRAQGAVKAYQSVIELFENPIGM